jgi:hypothetical protein
MSTMRIWLFPPWQFSAGFGIGFRLPIPINDQYRPKYSLRFQMLGIFAGGGLLPQMTDTASNMRNAVESFYECRQILV